MTLTILQILLPDSKYKIQVTDIHTYPKQTDIRTINKIGEHTKNLFFESRKGLGTYVLKNLTNQKYIEAWLSN